MLTKEDPRQVLRNLHVDESAHPVWSHAFEARVRLGQVSDDSFGSRSVSSVLIAIVNIGLLLGALGVLLCL